MAMDPDIIKAEDILKRLILRVNGVVQQWNTATKSFDITVSGASTETPFTPQLGTDADFLLNWVSGGTNGHAPTLDLVKGAANTRFGVDAGGNLGWQPYVAETAFGLILGAQMDRIATVTTGGTNGHTPTLEMDVGAAGQFIGMKANGQVGWLGVGESFSFTDTTLRSHTYSGGTGPFNTADSNLATFTNPSANQNLKLLIVHQLEWVFSHNATTPCTIYAGVEVSQNGGAFAMPVASTGFDDQAYLASAAGGTITWAQVVSLNPSSAVTFRAHGKYSTPSANLLGKAVTQPTSGSRFDMESYIINAIGVFQ